MRQPNAFGSLEAEKHQKSTKIAFLESKIDVFGLFSWFTYEICE